MQKNRLTNTMNSKLSHNDFEMLGHIKPTDAPPFLFTRIEQRIKDKEQNKLKPSFVWTLSITMILLLLINIIVLKNESKNSLQSTENNLLSSLNLNTNNSLYQ